MTDRWYVLSTVVKLAAVVMVATFFACLAVAGLVTFAGDLARYLVAIFGLAL